jgi:hypothetical protein
MEAILDSAVRRIHSSFDLPLPVEARVKSSLLRFPAAILTQSVTKSESQT